MQQDFEDINVLSAEQGFKEPETLLAAVLKACPSAEFIVRAGEGYGNNLPPAVTLKLREVAQYARTQTFQAYLDFETQLWINHLSQDSDDRPVHIRQQMPLLVLGVIRHALCKLDRRLHDRVTLLAQQFEAGLEAVKLQPRQWTPQSDAQEETAAAAFDRAIEGGRLDPNDQDATDSWHLAILDDEFLDAARQCGIFADGPSQEPILPNEYPDWAAQDCLEAQEPESGPGPKL